MNHQLIEGLDKVVKVSGKDSVIFIRAGDSKLAVSGSGELHSVSYRAPISSDEYNFTVALSPDTAKQLLRHHKDSSFRVDNNLLYADSDSGSAVFTLVDEKPRGGIQLPKEGFSITPSELARMFQEVKHASNNPQVGDMRFKGFHLSRKGRIVEVMATDGNVIAVTNTSIPDDGDDLVVITNPEFFVATEAVKDADNLEVLVGDSVLALKAGLSHGILYVNSALINAEPLDYKPVVDATGSGTVFSFRVDRKKLLTTLSKMSFFTNEESKQRITLSIAEGMCTITSDGVKGRVNEVVPMLPVHDDEVEVEASVSWKYLNSIFSSSKSDTLFIRGKTGKQPLLVETSDTSLAVLTVFSD